VSGGGEPVARAIVLYGREGCHLCDEALAGLEPLARGLGVGLQVVDIESDDRLLREYLAAIPVIVWGDAEIARLDEFRQDGFSERVRDFVRGTH
jgi:glutaredoxin